MLGLEAFVYLSYFNARQIIAMYRVLYRELVYSINIAKPTRLAY